MQSIYDNSFGRDLDFALSIGVDWVALSFVQRPEDIVELRSLIKERKSTAKIMAKLEKPSAIKYLNEVCYATTNVDIPNIILFFV